MGRWAQRTIRGGGPPSPAAVIVIIEAGQPESGDKVRLTYSAPIDAADFDLTDFETQLPSNPAIINQAAADALDLDFGMDVTADSPLTYSGDAPGVLSPQVVDYAA